MKIIFPIILFFHSIIHFVGFAQAFNYLNIKSFTIEITKTEGTIWLIASLLLIFTAILYYFKYNNWLIISILALIISQFLIFSFWEEAKYGTIINFVILLVTISGLFISNFEKVFRKDVDKNLSFTKEKTIEMLTESDIKNLPQPVQKYLRYCKLLNKPKVLNMKVFFEGEMRDKGKNWFQFDSVQYNFFDEPTRLFFMKAKMFGATVPGYHDYQNKSAKMLVKMFGIFKLAEAKGPEMDKAETVTLFNDMCLMAPSTLIDNRITWEPIDEISTKATFINGQHKISAILHFNHLGQLTNFVSDDRYAISDMKQYRFSTPISDYKLLKDINIATYGEAIWHYPEGAFVYGKFHLKSIQYNVSK